MSQLVHDNVLTSQQVTVQQLLKCARSAKLKAKVAHLTWDGLTHLKKALPVIVTLKNGASMVLLRLARIAPKTPRWCWRIQNAGEDALLVVDQIRFEAAWSGDVILVKRDYDISDESQPFSIGLISALIFRERWVVRDVAICAVVLSILALTPIVFWRVLSDKVIYFKAYNTFYVLCIAMAVLVIFEAIFAYVRQFLIVHLTTQSRRQARHLHVRQGVELADGIFRAHPDRKDCARPEPNVANWGFPDGTAFRNRFGFHDTAGFLAGHVLF